MILYSTNVYLKFYIQQTFYNDIHYVWCSESFDSKKLSSYSPGHAVPPSSNPADIYRTLAADVNRKDKHSGKVVEQRASLKALAIKFEKSGKITKADKNEIVYLAENADIDLFRPIIYIIPRAPVETRLTKVPMASRAGLGVEFIIQDLSRSEFDLIEL